MFNSTKHILASAVSVALYFSSISIFAASNSNGLDKSNFDTTAQACTDFYQYSNGNWLKNNPVPAAYSSWGLFNELNDRNQDLLKSILQDTAKQKFAQGTNAQKISHFYASAMDEKGIEKAGFNPIKSELKKIAQTKSQAQIVDLIHQWHAKGAPVLFGFASLADLKNSSLEIGYAGQDGLGLPDRDYYTRDDADSKALRQKYLAHMQKMLQLIGEKPASAKQQANWVLAMETRLANASLTNVELRDPSASYLIKTVAEADQLTPNFSWSKYFASQGISSIQSFSYSHPKFFAELNKLLGDTPVAQWQAYLRWNLVRAAAPLLSSKFVNENFDFYSKTLSGQKELKPRWKRSLDAVNGALGEALGELYVAKVFPPEAKSQMMDLITNLQTSVKKHIQSLDWMSAETKQQALKKLSTFTPKIGYPDKWKDYSAMQIKQQHYFLNAMEASQWARKDNLKKIGKAVDKTEWQMNPQTVNAYYNPLYNEIVFPAAILQPPFFDKDADPALNYGTIGAVIGHEVIHGFDDEGSKFDADGNLKDWWSADDRKKFESRTEKLGKQFDTYEPLPGVKVNGKLTMGENIADLGGLTMAYDALQMSLTNKRVGLIDGFTQDQRFFLGWSQGWRRNHTPEQLKLMVNTDPHSPSKYRVNGPLANLDAFRNAFACKEGDAMVRRGETQVKIW